MAESSLPTLWCMFMILALAAGCVRYARYDFFLKFLTDIQGCFLYFVLTFMIIYSCDDVLTCQDPVAMGVQNAGLLAGDWTACHPVFTHGYRLYFVF